MQTSLTFAGLSYSHILNNTIVNRKTDLSSVEYSTSK